MSKSNYYSLAQELSLYVPIILVKKKIAHILRYAYMLYAFSGASHFNVKMKTRCSCTSKNHFIPYQSLAVYHTMQHIGSMTVAQVTLSFVALVVLLVKLLFQLFDTIMQMITKIKEQN